MKDLPGIYAMDPKTMLAIRIDMIGAIIRPF